MDNKFDNILKILPNWLRWLLALPVAYIGGWLGGYLSIISYCLATGGSYDTWQGLLIAETSEILIFVAILYYFVPAYKFWSILLITLLLGGYSIYLLTISTSIIQIIQYLLITVLLCVSCVAVNRSEKIKCDLSNEKAQIEPFQNTKEMDLE